MESTEITIQSKVETLAERSGTPFEIDITELTQLAERGRAITSVDDPAFLEVKKEMQQKRKYITEYCKDAREEFNRMSKGVIQIQNTILDEFVGEEERLKEMDKAEKERLVMVARQESLPAKKERLDVIGEIPDQPMITDEEILKMDDAEFEIYINQRQADKNEADRLALEEEKKRVAEEAAAKEAELARKQAEADRIEAAREEERKKAEEALKLEKERLEREKKEAEERAEREKAEAEERRLEAIRKEEAEKARIAAEEKAKVEAEAKAKEEAEAARVAAAEAKAADEKYQAWIASLGEGEFKFITLENGNVEAYKLVDTYAKN